MQKAILFFANISACPLPSVRTIFALSIIFAFFVLIFDDEILIMHLSFIEHLVYNWMEVKTRMWVMYQSDDRMIFQFFKENF